MVVVTDAVVCGLGGLTVVFMDESEFVSTFDVEAGFKAVFTDLFKLST